MTRHILRRLDALKPHRFPCDMLLRLGRGQRARRQSKTCLAACSANLSKMDRLEIKENAEGIVDVGMIPTVVGRDVRINAGSPS